MLCQNPDPGSLASLPPDQKLLVAQVRLALSVKYYFMHPCRVSTAIVLPVAMT